MTAVPLSLPDLALASVLMLANVAASLLLRWQLHREFMWASARMVVQLLLVGLVLRIVFKAASPLASIVVAMLMIAAAAREVAVRPTWGLRGLRKYYLSTSVVRCRLGHSGPCVDDRHPAEPVVRPALCDPAAGHCAGQCPQ
jgi:putative ABC transport system permease protein